MECPQCRSTDRAGASFCANCGMVLLPPHQRVPGEESQSGLGIYSGGSTSDLEVAGTDAEAQPVNDTESTAPEELTIKTGVPQAEHIAREFQKSPGSPMELAGTPTALEIGIVLGDRYVLKENAWESDGILCYLASDQRYYEECWECGSTENRTTDTFCSSCGGDLEAKVVEVWQWPQGHLCEWIELLLSPPHGSLLPRVYEVVTCGDSECIVVERVSGLPAASSIPIKERQIARWLCEAAEAIALLDGAGLFLPLMQPQSLVLVGDRVRISDLLVCLVKAASAMDVSVSAQFEDVGRLALYLGTGYQETQALEASTLLPELKSVIGQALARCYEDTDELIAQLTNPVRRMTIGYLTHMGTKRQNNEDAFLAVESSAAFAGLMVPSGICAVADGAGGGVLGEAASKLALQRMADVYMSGKLVREVLDRGWASFAQMEGCLLGAFSAASEAILELGAGKAWMGTTATASLISGNRAVIANVGDTRTYLLREGQLRQITQDHSWVAEEVRRGNLDPEAVYSHPARNKITKCLDNESQPEPEISRLNVRPGDRLMLCCDGLWSMLRDHEIQAILQEASQAQTACDRLVEAANGKGADDNVTAVIVEMG